MFGGASTIQTFNDLWIFRHQQLEWHSASVVATAARPSPRRYATLTPYAKSQSNSTAATQQIADSFYLYGGESGEGAPLDEMWRLTITTGPPYTAVWSKVSAFASPTAPSGRSRHVAANARGAIYIFGGYGVAGPMGDLWEYAPTTSSWVLAAASGGVTSVSAGNTVPVARSSAVGGVVGGGLVIFGGDQNGMALGDTWRFDLVRGAWARIVPTVTTAGTLSSEPAPRTGAVAAVIASETGLPGGLIVTGGIGAGNVVMSDAWRFVDVSATGAGWLFASSHNAVAASVVAGGGDGAWGGSASLLVPSGTASGRRYGASAVAAATGIFVFGGQVLPAAGGAATASRDVLFLAPTGSNVWSGPSAPAAFRVPIAPIAPSPLVPAPNTACPDPGVPRGTARTGGIPPFIPGDMLKYTCLPGFGSIVGDSYLLCLGAVWSARAPTCSVSAPIVPAPLLPALTPPPLQLWCDAPPAECCLLPTVATGVVVTVLLPAGLIVAPGATPVGVPVGTTLRFGCDTAGFALIGTATEAACTILGAWTAQPPICALAPGAQPSVPLPPTVPIGLGVCPDPGVPANGVRDGGSLVVGAVVRFSCLVGYVLRGSAVIACGASLKWTDVAPTCVCGGSSACGGVPVTFCAYPGAPVNGFASIEPGQVVAAGVKVEFSCAVGYTLDGPSSVTCRSDGSFDFMVSSIVSNPAPPSVSGSPFIITTHQRLPLCVRRLCGRPPTIAGADVATCANTPAGEWCNVHCLKDQETASGPLWCGPGGEWTSPLPYCMRTSCNTPPSIGNGLTGHCAATRPGQECEVGCISGYVASGRLQCVAGTGVWATPYPECHPRGGTGSSPLYPYAFAPTNGANNGTASIIAAIVAAAAAGVFLVLLSAAGLVLGLLGVGKARAKARKQAERASEYAIEVRDNSGPPPPPPRVDQRLIRDAAYTVDDV